MLRILFIGDIFGEPGRRAVHRLLPVLKSRLDLDLVVANGENASGGLGLSAPVAGDLLAAGVDVLTTGNHVWKHRDLQQLMRKEPRVLRPGNYPPGSPGRGEYSARTRSGVPVTVINLEGRVLMSPLDDPFRHMDDLLAGPVDEGGVVVVDFHAEATSEKQAMGWHLDGRVTAVVGTHTHVQTADERILPGGTAYITDLGLTGPMDSVIGMDRQTALSRFTTQRPQRFKVAGGRTRLQGALVTVDASSGRATAIQRISENLE